MLEPEAITTKGLTFSSNDSSKFSLESYKKEYFRWPQSINLL